MRNTGGNKIEHQPGGILIFNKAHLKKIDGTLYSLLESRWLYEMRERELGPSYCFCVTISGYMDSFIQPPATGTAQEEIINEIIMKKESVRIQPFSFTLPDDPEEYFIVKNSRCASPYPYFDQNTRDDTVLAVSYKHTIAHRILEIPDKLFTALQSKGKAVTEHVLTKKTRLYAGQRIRIERDIRTFIYPENMVKARIYFSIGADNTVLAKADNFTLGSIIRGFINLPSGYRNVETLQGTPCYDSEGYIRSLISQKEFKSFLYSGSLK